MKSRFSTIDVMASLAELQSLLHMRLINVYDIDNRTYLLKLSRQEEKAVLLLESGNRIHRTDYEWPKNPAPSGFTMKLRKHIHNRRLEKIEQLGIDRIVDLQFGCNEAAYHVILELYDKGNIVLTDFEYTILNVLRPRTEKETVRFAVRETYPIHLAKRNEPMLSKEEWQPIFEEAKLGDPIKRILNLHSEYSPALIDHALLKAKFSEGEKTGKNFQFEEDWPRLEMALQEAHRIFGEQLSSGRKGYIIQKQEMKMGSSGGDVYLAFSEFHPFLFHQHEGKHYLEFPTFNKAVDEYFSQLETQRLDLKVIQKEKEAYKKLENVRKDHEHRIDTLQKVQEEDKIKAELIEMNLNLVTSAITTVQSALANQLQWNEVATLIGEAAQRGEAVAASIKELKLDINNITLWLGNPFEGGERLAIDIDLDLSAYANAKRYFDKKRKAVVKEQKTTESSAKALKSAERKTKQTLKEAATISSINKARKTHWFEKFLWFISSENYLVIGGHDQQQNELIVKRYMRPGDIYVHADLIGAATIIIKNPSGSPVSPKTLNEAGTMAVCRSVAWDNKVVTSAWWVHHDQVSKTAPTGEYLTTGSFMIRGKKNYLPPCYLIMGFGFLFRLDDESIPNHKDERRIKTMVDEGDDGTLSNVIEDEVDVACEESDNEEEGKNGESISESVEKDSEDSPRLEKASDASSDETEFPDTTVHLEHVEGDKFHVKACVPTQFSAMPTLENKNDRTAEAKCQGVLRQQDRKAATATKNTKAEDSDKASLPENSSGPSQMKRGHKYKMKKMREKYKHQDDEERELAMAILQPAGERKKKKEKAGSKGKGSAKNPPRKVHFPQQTPTIGEPAATVAVNDVNKGVQQAVKASPLEATETEDDKEDKQQVAEDAQLVDALTGSPIAEDVLLYAVPVCGPYNAVVNYKFKIKLTPGSGKRGKAAKMALNIFLHEKSITPREKDLLRSVKDQDISRNLPGKVKLTSTSNLLKQKHR